MTNAHYETSGALNFNAFANPIAVERFVAPGAPIAGWGGVRVSFLSARACPGQPPVERPARRQISSQSLSANTQITPP